MIAAKTKATCRSVPENENAGFPTAVVVFPGGGAWGTVVVLVCMSDVDCPVLEEELVEEEEEEVVVEVV